MKKEYDFSKGVRGPVIPLPPSKIRITIRIDKKVLDWFRNQVNEAGGGSYQAMMNDALADYIRSQSEPFKATIRSVVREELAAYGKRQRRGAAK